MSPDPHANPDITPTPASTPDLPAPDPAGGQAAVLRWQPAAAALRPESVVPMAADGRLAWWNINRAIPNFTLLLPTLKLAVPLADWPTIEKLADLALATAHAEAVVDRAEPPETGLPALRARVGVVRGQLLGAADLLASFGKLSAAKVTEIHKGRGLPDMASDAGVLSQLFHDNWATVQGLTPVTKELVQEAGEVSASLLGLLKPGGGRGHISNAELDALRDQRNRLWTLLATAHSDLSAAAYWQWREAFRQFVPNLQSRKG